MRPLQRAPRAPPNRACPPPHPGHRHRQAIARMAPNQINRLLSAVSTSELDQQRRLLESYNWVSAARITPRRRALGSHTSDRCCAAIRPRACVTCRRAVLPPADRAAPCRRKEYELVTYDEELMGTCLDAQLSDEGP